MATARRFAEAGRLLLDKFEIRVDNVASLEPELRGLAMQAAEYLSQSDAVQEAIDIMLAMHQPDLAIAMLERAGNRRALELVRAAEARQLPRSEEASPHPRIEPPPTPMAEPDDPDISRSPEQLESNGYYTLASEAYGAIGRHADAARMAMVCGDDIAAARHLANAGEPFEAAKAYLRAGDPRHSLDQLMRVDPSAPTYRKAAVEAIRVANELDTISFRLDQFLKAFIDLGSKGEDEIDALCTLGNLYQAHEFHDSARSVFRALAGPESEPEADSPKSAPPISFGTPTEAPPIRPKAPPEDRPRHGYYRLARDREDGAVRQIEEDGHSARQSVPIARIASQTLPDGPLHFEASAAAAEDGQTEEFNPLALDPLAFDPEDFDPALLRTLPLSTLPPAPAAFDTNQRSQIAPPPSGAWPGAGPSGPDNPTADEFIAGPEPTEPAPESETPESLGTPTSTDKPSVDDETSYRTVLDATPPLSTGLDVLVGEGLSSNKSPMMPSIVLSSHAFESASARTGYKIGSIVAGRYRIERQIGRGGMAIVFRATDLELGEEIALKVFYHPLENNELVARFKQEIKLARRLVHPNLIRLYDIGLADNYRYITMELLVGNDIYELLGRPVIDATVDPLPLDSSLDYLIQTCAGLQAVHDENVVHRDIKPDNIFVTESGRVKLMDFGIAKEQYTAGVTLQGVTAGTPEYMAPEQLKEFSNVTAATDLYALGITAYQMTTGSLPFSHQDLLPLLMMHAAEPPPPPRKRNPRIPVALEAAILRLLAKRPDQRFQSCRELSNKLREIREAL